MKLLSNIIEKPFMSLIEHRPWGHYGLYSDNEHCTTKILYIAKEESLSLQYHFRRDQLYVLLDDDFTIDYSSSEVPEELINLSIEDWRVKGFEKFLEDHMITTPGSEGDMFGFKRKILHRAAYHGNRRYGRILDVAFGENDELDIVRIKDKYGRI
jgi:hypothetical protein